MTNTDQLMALVQKWRGEAKRLSRIDGCADKSFTLDDCADELESLARALSQPVGAGEGFVVVPRAAIEKEIAALESPVGCYTGAVAKGLRTLLAAPTPPAAEDARDKARLDWLDGFTATSGYGIDELFGSAGSRRYVSLRDSLSCDDEVLGEGPTLRAAIDAAMSGDGEVR